MSSGFWTLLFISEQNIAIFNVLYRICKKKGSHARKLCSELPWCNLMDWMQWTPLQRGFVPCRFIFVGFCERQCLRPPRYRQHYTSSRHGSERLVQTLIRNFSTCGRRLNIGLMLLEQLVSLTINFINDKLLFIKLFQLVFQLVRVL
jgi:hypothetical protein